MTISLLRFIFTIIFTTGFYTSFSTNEEEYITDNRIILQEGLSQNRITSIIEDDFGFMWFGTADGLNRYDGNTIQIFRKIYGDSTSLPSSKINSMALDNNGNFWIGTNNGIALFNPYTNTSSSYMETDSVAIALGANKVTSVVVDKNNDVWYSTEGYGVIKINPNTKEKSYYFYSESDSCYMNNIDFLYVDNSNRLWLGIFIDQIVRYFDIDNNIMKSININTVNIHKKNLKLLSFYEDSEDRIWTSIVDYDSINFGLFYLDKDSNRFINYGRYINKINYKKYADCYNSINSFTSDNSGNIWFSSLIGGLFRFKFGETPVAYFVESPGLDSRINCIYCSTNNLIWIGTNGSGVEISVSDKTNFSLINCESDNRLEVESIRCIYEGENYYWVGGYYGLAKISKDFKEIETVNRASVYSISAIDNYPNTILTGSEGGGLRPFNIESGSFGKMDFNPNDPNLPYLKYIFNIYPSSDTLVLLGTQNGLYGFNPFSKITYKFPFDFLGSRKINTGTAVRTIYTDPMGNILIGYVQGGVGKLDLKNKIVKKFSPLKNLEGFDNFNPINCLYNDSSEVYWIATTNGLIKYNTIDQSIKLFTIEDGLPNSHIYGILPDEEGNLWLSTNNGLSCYVPDEELFRNYDISDMLQNNEFNTGAYIKSSDGDLFFGGIDGINYFNPSEIKQNSLIPIVVITGVKMENNYVQLSKKDLEDRIFEIPSNIEMFTIEFTGLSFINIHKNKYKYKIIELSDKWIDIDNQNEITFYGMSPGTYNIEILASNNHGLWLTEPYKCVIIIHPKFYESNLFRWLMALLIVVLIIVGIRLRLKSITSQKNKLQLLVDQQTSILQDTNKDLKVEITKHSDTTKELEKTIDTKDKFLSIIAHDILGPLGVIQGFSDLMIEDENGFSNDEKLAFVKTISITSKQLSLLLSNLLQWSRIQNKSIEPELAEVNVLDTTQQVHSLLNGNINEKDIKFILNINKNHNVFVDKNMLLTILRNLISNAIKFTPNNGNITVTTLRKGVMLEVIVSDTGKGIEESFIDSLFDADVNFTTKGTNNEPGTGLGLKLVSEFVSISGGKIWLKSKVDTGTAFYFTLPIYNK